MAVTIRISQAGGCPRRIALEARGVQGLPVSPATQRAFDEGNLHEASILEWAAQNLPGAPYDLDHQQSEVRITNTPLVGHIDALAYGEHGRFLLEAKCLAARSFQELRERGCRQSHPQYYAQVQLYLYALCESEPWWSERHIDPLADQPSKADAQVGAFLGPHPGAAYLVARNKETPMTRPWDHHYELVEFDWEYARDEIDRLCALAAAIDRGDEIPVPEGWTPETQWRCRVRWCPFGYGCHPDYRRKRVEAVRRDELADAVEQYQSLGEQIAELTAARDELRDRLLASVDGAPIQAGTWLVTAQERRTERFDTKAARQQLPADVLARLLTVTTSKTLRIEEVV